MGDIRLGRKNVLTVVKKVDFVYYLDGGVVDGEVLLPNGEIMDEVEIVVGEDIECFVYLDTE